MKKKSNKQKHQEYVDFVTDILTGISNGKYTVIQEGSEDEKEYWRNFLLEKAREYLIKEGKEDYTYHMEVVGKSVRCMSYKALEDIEIQMELTDESGNPLLTCLE